MRKAISFSGQSRFVLEGFESLRKNLVDFKEYDIFIHTWESPLNKDCYLYEPRAIHIEPQVDVKPKEVQECSDVMFTHFSMFYSMKKSLDLLKWYEENNNIKYHTVIRTRFDIELASPLSTQQHCNLNTVYSPDVCANPNVISDWFNFSTSETIDLYRGIYDNIVNYWKQGVMVTSGEEIITHMLKTNNINIGKIPCTLNLLRDRNIHKTLSSFWKYAN